jgi:hypothetical protein
MPTWHAPSEEMLNDALSEAVLAIQVDDNPPFQEVTGLEPGAFVKHAVEGVACMLANSGQQPFDPEALIQLYSLGFVVGMKYGEKRAQRDSA